MKSGKKESAQKRDVRGEGLGGGKLTGREATPTDLSGLTLAGVKAEPLRRESLSLRPQEVESTLHSRGSVIIKSVASCCVTWFVSCLSM